MKNRIFLSAFRIIRFIKIRAFLKSTSNFRSFDTKLALLSLSVQNWQVKESYYSSAVFYASFFRVFQQGVITLNISTFRIIRFIKIWAFLKSTSNFRSFTTKFGLLSLSVQKWQAKECYHPSAVF